MRLCFSVFAAAVLATACGESGGSSDAGTSPFLVCDTAAADVLTAKVYADIVTPTCVSNCHKPGGSAVTYGEWETLEKFQAKAVSQGSQYSRGGTLKVVDPSRPENSSLLLKVLGGGSRFRGPNGENVGAQMPQGGTALSDAQKTLLRDWICKGARVN